MRRMTLLLAAATLSCGANGFGVFSEPTRSTTPAATPDDASCAPTEHLEPGKGCVENPAAATPPDRPGTEPKAAPATGRMVALPAATFLMGDGKRRVPVKAFEMDVTEVTVEAYRACIKAGPCTTPEAGAGCYWEQSNMGQLPMNCVDWDQATTYCTWAGKRLPTEQEWEYGARGTDGRTYPWGNSAPAGQLSWDGEGNSDGKGNRQSPSPVGKYPAGASPFGLMDMAGNLVEWTSSPYDATSQVVRGGSWRDGSPTSVQASYRTWNNPKNSFYFIGFRCARTPA